MDKFLIIFVISIGIIHSWADPAAGTVTCGKIFKLVLPREIRPLNLSEIDQALVIFNDPIVQSMSHDKIQRDGLIYSLGNPKEFLYGIWSGEKMVGVVQAYQYPPGVAKFKKVQSLLERYPNRTKLVGIGLHLLPAYFGDGTSQFARQKLLEMTFADPEVGAVWAAVYRDNIRSRTYMEKFSGKPVVLAGEYNDYDYFFFTFEDYQKLTVTPDPRPSP